MKTLNFQLRKSDFRSRIIGFSSESTSKIKNIIKQKDIYLKIDYKPQTTWSKLWSHCSVFERNELNLFKHQLLSTDKFIIESQTLFKIYTINVWIYIETCTHIYYNSTKNFVVLSPYSMLFISFSWHKYNKTNPIGIPLITFCVCRSTCKINGLLCVLYVTCMEVYNPDQNSLYSILLRIRVRYSSYCPCIITSYIYEYIYQYFRSLIQFNEKCFVRKNKSEPTNV